jgi:hypothetical protein
MDLRSLQHQTILEKGMRSNILQLSSANFSLESTAPISNFRMLNAQTLQQIHVPLKSQSQPQHPWIRLQLLLLQRRRVYQQKQVSQQKPVSQQKRVSQQKQVSQQKRTSQ